MKLSGNMKHWVNIHHAKKHLHFYIILYSKSKLIWLVVSTHLKIFLNMGRFGMKINNIFSCHHLVILKHWKTLSQTDSRTAFDSLDDFASFDGCCVGPGSASQSLWNVHLEVRSNLIWCHHAAYAPASVGCFWWKSEVRVLLLLNVRYLPVIFDV